MISLVFALFRIYTALFLAWALMKIIFKNVPNGWGKISLTEMIIPDEISVWKESGDQTLYPTVSE